MSDTKQTVGEPERARLQLDRAAAGLDELTVARLRAGRKRAVAAAGVRRPYRLTGRPSWWLPLSAAAAAIVTVSFALQWWRAPQPPTIAVTEDIELLTAMEGPEFFDNIDFYRWLEDQRDAG